MRKCFYNNGAGRTYSEIYTPTPLVAYTYADPAHVHAVTSLSNGNSYQYDAKGNTIQRTASGMTWNLRKTLS